MYEATDQSAIGAENAVWLPALVSHLEDGPLFAGLPARNLLGSSGLLAGLVEHGFTVTRLGEGTAATSEVEIVRHASLRSCRKFVLHSAELTLVAKGYSDDVRAEALRRMEEAWAAPDIAKGLRACLDVSQEGVDCGLEQTSLEDLAKCD